MDQSGESRDYSRPGLDFAARILGKLFRIWVRHVAGAKTARHIADGRETADGHKAASRPVYLVAAADLATAAVMSAGNTVACVKPGPANDAAAAFLKGCGARVGRQEYREYRARSASTDLPARDETVLVPIDTTCAPGIACAMAQALLVAARLERPAARLTVEAARTVTPWPDAPFAWRVPLGPARMWAGPTASNLATANARLAAARDLASPAPPGAARPPAPRGPPARPLALRFYSGAMRVLAPALVLYLTMRAKRGKEIWDRLAERRGIATAAREPGRLGWIHAASVGESVSILPLANRLLAEGRADRLLVTTGTITSAALMDIRLPEGALHQFLPLDVPRYVDAFLDFWRPEFALFTESEIWPNLLHGLDRHAIPHALLNGRMSSASFNRWRRWPTVARAALQSCSVCLVQTRQYATRYATLGAQSVTLTGNLKFDSPPPPADPVKLDRLRADLQGRPVWLAASTHSGEEEIVAQVHYTLRERYPELLTILVPRHPERAPDIAKMLEDRWLTTSRRSLGGTISAKIDVYIADTIGELGLFYRLAQISLVGGSLTAGGGGHNPVEPAQLENAILHGPQVRNFRDMYEIFDAGGGATVVTGAADLITQLQSLLCDPKRTARMIGANQSRIRANAGSLERTVNALRPVIGPPEATAGTDPVLASERSHAPARPAR